jgi:hypothetical protein
MRFVFIRQFETNIGYTSTSTCLGGRSLYFGGWSPRYLHTEMPTTPARSIIVQALWPPAVVKDLKERFFLEGAKQAGLSAANDFLNGNLQDFYRRQLVLNYAASPEYRPAGRIAGLCSGGTGRHHAGACTATSQPALRRFSKQPQVGRPIVRASSESAGFLSVQQVQQCFQITLKFTASDRPC